MVKLSVRRSQSVLVVVLLLVRLSTLALAEQESTGKATSALNVASKTHPKESAAAMEGELRLLRERNALLEKHNSELLQVVLWSIGFAAVFLVALFGLIGFFNERRYQRDRNALEQALDARIAKASADLEAKQTEWTDRLKAMLSSTADERFKAGLAPITAKLQSQADRVGSLEIQFIDFDTKNWEIKGALSNALTGYWRCAELARLVPGYGDWKVSTCLEKIAELLDKGGRFDATEVTGVTGFLNSLPSQYEPLRNKIQKKLSA